MVSNAASDEDFVGLADAIRQVRAELNQARNDGAGDSLRFAVGTVKLEFAVQVRRDGSGKAGIRIGVFTAEAGGNVAKESMHRLEVELHPVDEGGRAMEIEQNLDRIPER